MRFLIMSFLFGCCCSVEVEQSAPLIPQPKKEAKINGKPIAVQTTAPIPIPETVTVAIQPQSSSYYSFTDQPGFPQDGSDEDVSDEIDDE
jgi:hypothetical protein